MKQSIPHYCGKNTLLIPKSLYQMADARPIMTDNDAAIFYKHIKQDMLDIEFYTSTPCLAFVIKGEETFTSFDHEVFHLREREMLLMPRNLYMLSDFTSNAGPLEALLFFFDRRTMEAYLRQVPLCQAQDGGAHRPCKLGALEPVSRYMQGLMSVYSGVQGNGRLLRTKLLELLFLIDSLGQGGRLRSFLAKASADGAKRNIRHLMKEHQNHNLRVSDFAALSGRSVASFNRDFKRQFGVTPNQWLMEARLEKAHALIQETSLSVTEVALEVGYTSTSHFIKSFKARYGVTPRQVRAQLVC